MVVCLLVLLDGFGFLTTPSQPFHGGLGVKGLSITRPKPIKPDKPPEPISPINPDKQFGLGVGCENCKFSSFVFLISTKHDSRFKNAIFLTIEWNNVTSKRVNQTHLLFLQNTIQDSRTRLELEEDEGFDILNWWKLNSPRFSIVSKMAKDILCIKVSTVASESAFSASGRVLDPYRNSLSPSIVEALVCTQDWIRTSSRNITLDTLEDLMKDDELAKEIQEALDKQKGEDGKDKNVAP
ncbi:zinc finger BED domain-containing protein RICESLEEPER 2 [Artemisia annua]|uniref:Zinc finger BED domain-containing protein RICESLEEPER 2 n=1 Tax=Artemisia annua TaxID=35608 RepID=A0A2U1LZ72_ARTAN|nr:zinc finger BED domain-containing protein RICESLEEPER 2 [Artemisia annua]